jgi:hypothetical protein
MGSCKPFAGLPPPWAANRRRAKPIEGAFAVLPPASILEPHGEHSQRFGTLLTAVP